MKLVSGAKFATVVFLMITIVAFSFAWRNRRALLQDYTTTRQKISVDASRVPNPSPATKMQLTQFANSKNDIMGVNIIRVDFAQNTRSSTFRYYKEQAVSDEWNEFLKSGRQSALFGDNESANQRLVALINGQFSCTRTIETEAGRFIPAVNQFSLATCMAPIPPGYGDFVGFINIFLRSQPTGSEIQELETITNQIARDMYERDVVKSTQRFAEELRK